MVVMIDPCRSTTEAREKEQKAKQTHTAPDSRAFPFHLLSIWRERGARDNTTKMHLN
jgi:hypothetical protein